MTQYVHLFVVTIITVCVQFTHTEDVFASITHLKTLADGERSILGVLDEYISHEQTRLQELSELLSDVQRAHQLQGETDSLSFVGNPLNAFHLIKRFATTWRSVWYKVSHFDHYYAVKEETERLSPFLPEDSDYDGALQSVIRVQKIYRLNTEALQRGDVLGRTTAPLSQQTCYNLGSAAITAQLPDLALEWFDVALTSTVPPLAPQPSLLWLGLADGHGMKNELDKAIVILKSALKLDPANPHLTNRLTSYTMKKITSKRHGVVLQNPMTSVPLPEWRTNYEELCRESVYNTSLTYINPSATCELRRSRFVPYQYVKVEYVARSPDVYLFHEFLSDAEGLRVMEVATPMLSRAKVGMTTNSSVSSDRVGKVAWFFDNSTETLFSRISRRVAEATGLNVTHPTCEPLQVGNYGVAGHYEPHYDHDEYRFRREPGNDPPEMLEAGDRVATLMIYLSDVEEGGATVFPKRNIFVRPVKNAAVMWNNYLPTGEQDTRSLHAACPVLLGEKWVGNKWIRERGQELVRPCGLTADDHYKLP